MQPLNANDRKKSFINFLLLFLLCIAIITVTIFFSIQVPFKQNDQLLKEMRSVTKEREFSISFMTQMTEIAGMLDTINTKAQKPDLLDGRISDNIKKLNLKIDADSVENQVMYRNIVFVLSDIQTAKKQLREITGKDLNADDLRKTIEGLTAALEAEKSNHLTLKGEYLKLLQQRSSQ